MANQITVTEMEQDIDTVSDISQLLHIIVMKMNFMLRHMGWFTAFSRWSIVERYSITLNAQPRIGKIVMYWFRHQPLIHKEIYGFLTLIQIHHYL